MKPILTALFCVFSFLATGQSFNLYKDTSNRFSIYIPAGWKYGASRSQPTVKFICYNDADTLNFNFNLNIIETPNSTLEATTSNFLKYISATKGFKLLDSGQVAINERAFTWIMESHVNETNNLQPSMHNLDFVTYDKNKTYILTMAALSKNFDQALDIFRRIANTFKLLE